jgi:hypothetical protein
MKNPMQHNPKTQEKIKVSGTAGGQMSSPDARRFFYYFIPAGFLKLLK